MRQLNALIIDDDQLNVSVLTSLLSRQNINSDKILHPGNLMSELENIGPVDIIFLDLEMPVLDGYDVFELLSKNERFQHVPIVACTVHVSEKNAIYNHGFHSFLSKPLDPDAFPGQLARILDGEQVWE